MKNIKLKIVLALLFSSFLVLSTNAEYGYDDVKAFERYEGKICEAATDGCNNYFFKDGKITGGTLKLCTDFDPLWKCTRYKDGIRAYYDKENFEKNEGMKCQNATDGCNTYFMTKDGKIGGGTLMACEGIIQLRYCTNYKIENNNKSYNKMEDFEKNEGLKCQSATDGCNTYFMTKDGKVGGGTLKYCEGFVESWTCLKEDDMLKVLSSSDLETYLKIKGGKINPQSILIIDDYTKKYLDTLSKLDKNEKDTKLNNLTKAIDEYILNLKKKEKYSKNLELKINVLNLLKFNIQKEVYYSNENTKDNSKTDEKPKMHPSWDIDNDGINDCEKENICDDTVDYTLPRTFNYTCDDNKKMSIQVTPDSLVLNDNITKRLYYLKRTISADGEKFVELGSDGKELNMVWLKGDGAFFERDGKTFYSNCKLSK